MTLSSIRQSFKKHGILGGIFHYACRAAFRIQAALIGRFAKATRTVCENRIVFKNREFQDYSDSPRAFSDYLIQNGYHHFYQIIWMVSDRNQFRHIMIPNVKFVTSENRFGWSSPAACWYGATAKYFFYTNNSAGLNRYHCSGQIVINLWHGCGYKDNLAKKKKTELTQFDYMLVPGKLFITAKASYWGCSKEKILPLGYPRYDWMLAPDLDQETILSKIFPCIPVNEISKIILWMPTFRNVDNDSFENIDLPFELPGLQGSEDLDAIDQICRKHGILLIIKKHPIQSPWRDYGSYTNVYFLCDRDLHKVDVHLYSLIGICDALISDYSSAAVDYLLLDRPMAFVLADYIDYQKARGFIFDNPIQYMPGEKVFSLEDLLSFIEHVASGIDLFKEERQKLLPIMHNRTNHYSERLASSLNLDKSNRSTS